MVFKPKFSYTSKIVRNLTIIAEARAIVLNASLVPKWEVTLRRDAILKSAHASTAIEGNPLTMEEVTALAEGRKIMVRKKDRQEVLNYLDALKRLPEFASLIPFSSDDLLEIHDAVTKGTLDNPKDEGTYRTVQNYIGNKATGEVVFMPPPPEDVIPLVNEFLEWYGSEEAEELDSIIEAGIAHYELVRIHPFVDGNGRSTRVIAAMTLYRRGFDTKRYFALDDYYDQDRRSYYEALNSVDQETLDLTGWLEYFTEGVAVSINSVKEKVIGLSKDIKVLKDKGQISLTDRQIKIVEQMVEGGKITNKEVREMFEVSNRAALNEIEKLIDMKIIEQKGEGRSTHYILI